MSYKLSAVLWSFRLSASAPATMVLVSVSLHPSGLHPTEAARAHHLRHEEGLAWPDICDEVLNLKGKKPSIHAVRNAVVGVERGRNSSVVYSNYDKCGRKAALTKAQAREVVKFVKRWRHKRFCTCRYIRSELKLKVSNRTVARVLNQHGFHWRPVPKVRGLSKEDLAARKAFVAKYSGRSPAWWMQHMNMVLDGVTLTIPPKAMSGKQKHAAQRIQHMWMRNGERMENEIHTHNRYGVQLGQKVPLWGGFSGGGQFTLRLWTPNPKMTQEDWERCIPKIKRSIDTAEKAAPYCGNSRPKVWHDNEKFLINAPAYQRNGLQMVRFPPNSGDLNPIETIWAKLRADLAVREQADSVPVACSQSISSARGWRISSRLTLPCHLATTGTTYRSWSVACRSAWSGAGRTVSGGVESDIPQQRRGWKVRRLMSMMVNVYKKCIFVTCSLPAQLFVSHCPCQAETKCLGRPSGSCAE